MQVKKQQLESCIEQETGSKFRKEYIKAVYCHSACLTYMQSIWSAGLDEAQARIKFSGRNINNLRYADDINLYGREQRGTKEPLD